MARVVLEVVWQGQEEGGRRKEAAGSPEEQSGAVHEQVRAPGW